MYNKSKNYIMKNKHAIIGAFLFAFVVHFYILSNYIPNHDDLAGVIINMDLSTSGRWFSMLATRMSSVYTMHPVNGLICIGLVSLASVIMVDVLEIENTMNKIVTIALFIVFPTIAGVMSYMQTADGYGIAIFLAIVGCYFIKQQSLTGYIYAVVCFTLSCGIYQAYITISVGIMYILIVKKVFTNQKLEHKHWKEFFCYVSSIVVSISIYYVILQIVLKITNQSLSSYSNINTMGKFTISEIYANVIDVYKNFGYFFLGKGNTYSSIVVFANITIIGLIVARFASVFVKLKGINRLYVTLLFFSLPIAFNSIELIKPAGNECSILTTYTFVLLYVFTTTLYDGYLNVDVNTRRKRVLCYICIASLSIIVWNNYLLTNKIYMKLEMTWEKSKSWASGLMADIQEVDGYSEEIPIMIDGLESLNRENQKDAILDELDALLLTNSYTFCVDSNSYNENLLFHYYRILLDKDIVSVPEEQRTKIRDTAHYKAMPSYPNEGSIQTIDGCIVVKIDE